MYPLHHLILGTIFSLVLLILFQTIGLLEVSLIILSSVLIDVDHYLYYVYKKRDWSLKRAYEWFIENRRRILSLPRKKRSEYYSGFIFLHGFELVIILFVFSVFINKYLFFIGIGFAFHLILDFIYDRRYYNRFDRISAVYDYIKFKKLKKIWMINEKYNVIHKSLKD